MDRKHPFIEFLLEKAGFNDSEILAWSEEVKELNKQARQHGSGSVLDPETKNFALAYQRIRAREKGLAKVLAKQLKADDDPLDLQVSAWLNDLRKKKEDFLSRSADKQPDPNSVYRRVLTRENRTNELLHDLFNNLKNGFKDKQGELPETHFYYTPIVYKLAWAGLVALILAVAVVSFSPDLAGRITAASDSLLRLPFTTLDLSERSELSVSAPAANISGLPAQSPARLPEQDNFSAYIRGHNDQLELQAGPDGDIFVSQEDLDRFLALSEDSHIEVLGTEHEYDAKKVEEFLDRIKQLIIKKADEQKQLPDGPDEAF